MTNWSRTSNPKTVRSIETLGSKIATVRACTHTCVRVRFYSNNSDGDNTCRLLRQLNESCLPAIVAQAIERLGLLEGRPLSLLGQSAGASLAFEVAMNLKLLYGYTPEALFVVSMGPPQVCRYTLNLAEVTSQIHGHIMSSRPMC